MTMPKPTRSIKTVTKMIIKGLVKNFSLAVSALFPAKFSWLIGIKKFASTTVKFLFCSKIAKENDNILGELAKVMRKTLKLKLWLILITALIFSMYQETEAQRRNTRAKQPQPQKMQPEQAQSTIAFTVSMNKPWTHLLEVEMRYGAADMPAQAELKMPVWTPGSYLVREYARHVQDFEAKDASGKSLAWRKINKNTWQIDTGGAKEIVARYNVYANELTVRTNELNDQ